MHYSFYKVLHSASLFAMMASIGGMVALSMTKESHPAGKKLMHITHGIALVISFITGFGLIAKLGLPSPWPLWVFGKIIIWLILAISPLLIHRQPDQLPLIWRVIILLGLFAAYLAQYKPF